MIISQLKKKKKLDSLERKKEKTVNFSAAHFVKLTKCAAQRKGQWKGF